ncbi:GNAT family N-acetyltransferase [Butyrivibrio sp. FC2001]|uniref:GNAT family N-acetyltransferase n=1 Tax=Butyrivibrio sp. FC2001 TaxID=1280671 RepID=UPI0003FFCCD7|nr:GNAT family N-acetyltransferase [Butyrivibrio sp. FC2001]
MFREIDDSFIQLIAMTPEMYHSYFKEYENDPDLWLDKMKYTPYEYSEEKVNKYIQRQKNLNRRTLAIMCGGEIVGEVIIKNIEEHKCATLGICLKNAKYKDQGIGTQAERLAVRYVFKELDIPVLYADSIQPNTRSQHVLEKVGFKYVNEDADFKYYRIDRGDSE